LGIRGNLFLISRGTRANVDEHEISANYTNKTESVIVIVSDCRRRLS